MKAIVVLLSLVLVAAVGALLAEGCAFGGAWFLNRHEQYDDEIAWLERLEPLMRWEKGVSRLIARRERERMERALAADRIDRAVHLYQDARGRSGARGQEMDPALATIGIEIFRRASDRMEKHGRLSEAADWGDSALVLAIRSPAPEQRYAALAAFMEGLDLRVRDGKPCAALARVQWAKRGLGGTIPGMAENVEEDLALQCAQQRRGAGRR